METQSRSCIVYRAGRAPVGRLWRAAFPSRIYPLKPFHQYRIVFPDIPKAMEVATSSPMIDGDSDLRLLQVPTFNPLLRVTVTSPYLDS